MSFVQTYTVDNGEIIHWRGAKSEQIEVLSNVAVEQVSTKYEEKELVEIKSDGRLVELISDGRHNLKDGDHIGRRAMENGMQSEEKR